MIVIHATANDIERALHELHDLAAHGTCSNAHHAGNFLLALWDGDANPLNVTDFKYLDPRLMRQALQLLAFLMTTGTPLQKFMSEDAMDKVADNLSALACQQFTSKTTPPSSSALAEPATA